MRRAPREKAPSVRRGPPVRIPTRPPARACERRSHARRDLDSPVSGMAGVCRSRTVRRSPGRSPLRPGRASPRQPRARQAPEAADSQARGLRAPVRGRALEGAREIARGRPPRNPADYANLDRDLWLGAGAGGEETSAAPEAPTGSPSSSGGRSLGPRARGPAGRLGDASGLKNRGGPGGLEHAAGPLSIRGADPWP